VFSQQRCRTSRTVSLVVVFGLGVLIGCTGFASIHLVPGKHSLPSRQPKKQK